VATVTGHFADIRWALGPRESSQSVANSITDHDA
jgi:hypothetical protein